MSGKLKINKRSSFTCILLHLVLLMLFLFPYAVVPAQLLG